MSVYVDQPIWPWHGRMWAHLTADTLDELHAFAVGRLGLRRGWFQTKPGKPWQDHYDLTEAKRVQAINAGAVVLSTDEMMTHQARRRAEMPPGGADVSAATS